MIWILLTGLGSLVYGLTSFFSKTFFDWRNRNQKVITKRDYLIDRYIYPGSSFVAFGLMSILMYVLDFSHPSIRGEQQWLNTPFLVFAGFFLLFASLFFSRKFSDFFWRHVWYKVDIQTERKWMASSLVFISLSLLLAFYLFSGLFLIWP